MEAQVINHDPNTFASTRLKVCLHPSSSSLRLLTFNKPLLQKVMHERSSYLAQIEELQVSASFPLLDCENLIEASEHHQTPTGRQ